jgi:hypothetical protein
MKNVLCTFLLLGLFITGLHAQAGADRLAEIAAASKKEVEEGWVLGGGLGIDFAQLAFYQPRVGAGANRIGFGGLSNFYANYKKDKIAWSNNASLQLAAQRIGGRNSPFDKNIDIFRGASRFGYRPNEEGKFFGAIEGNFQTLLLPTYEGNILRPDNNVPLIAKFLSPVQVVVSAGIDYKHNENLSIFFAPASFKMIYVGDDNIAALTVHGNREGTNSFIAMGTTLKGIYNNKFLNEKLSWTAVLDLFSNYLENPQNIDVLWTNELGWTIFKNFSLNIVTELFYDDDVKVQIDRNNNGIFGEPGEFAPSVSITQALLIKYNYIF